MEKVLFIGAEKRESKANNTYYMMYAGHIISDNNGLGASPMSLRYLMISIRSLLMLLILVLNLRLNMNLHMTKTVGLNSFS